MNLTKGSADDVAYLVRQGQKEVVEEDGGGCSRVILIRMIRFQPQRAMNIDAHLSCGTGGIGV